eukprot:8157189-Pyramimonas_sp.AAC.2
MKKESEMDAPDAKLPTVAGRPSRSACLTSGENCFTKRSRFRASSFFASRTSGPCIHRPCCANQSNPHAP